MRGHFSAVASSYNKVRTTYRVHVSRVAKRMKPKSEEAIKIAEVGLGPARYTIPFIRELRRRFPDSRIDLTGIDNCREMLVEARKNLSGIPGLDSRFILGRGEDISCFCNNLDGILIFNAIHHLDVNQFLAACTDSLTDGGRIFIHTRTPFQNGYTLWGEHFPDFSEREKRLLPKDSMREKIESKSELELVGRVVYSLGSESSVKELIEQANKKHYSTLEYYGEKEFESALNAFLENLKGIGYNGKVFHIIGNTLYVVEKISPG